MVKLKEAMMWDTHRDKSIRCNLCNWRCIIPDGKYGYCGVRKNENGKLYTLTYGKLVSINIDPIEKKPFFHFYPGSKSLSIASIGCNFKCVFCCNYPISQTTKIQGKTYTPEQIVKMANDNQCKTIAYTYTEPTLMFEFAYVTGRLAHRYNIKNVFVTNGYMTVDAVKKIGRFLDAAVVDIKASLDPEFYKKYMSVPKVKPILDCIKQLHKQRIFLEITNLIIPGIGDNEDMNDKLVEWINSELGASIPYHVIAFTPQYRLTNVPPTPVETLEKMVDIARKRGLRYTYVGNVFGHYYENTYCHNCRELLIKRTGFFVEENNLVKNRCPNCGLKVNIVTE